MGLSHRASIGSRGLAVVFGAISVLAMSLPVAWSRVAADDASQGPGTYPGCLCDHRRQDRGWPRQDV